MLPRGRSSVLIGGVRCAVVLLTAVGVGAAIGRAFYVSDFTTRTEPLREQMLHALHRDDPNLVQTIAEIRRFDSRYAAHPFVAIAHVVSGGLYLAFAPFQFSSRVRRHIGFHRWSGRVLIAAAGVITGSAFYFGLQMPFAGLSEAITIAVFGSLFLFAVCRGYLNIRRRQVARHREWMIRAFAIAIGISMVRVAGFVFDVVLTPFGFGLPQVFLVSIWTGWALTVSVAEIWIRYTRAATFGLQM